MLVRALISAILCILLVLPGIMALNGQNILVNTAEAASSMSDPMQGKDYHQVGTASWYGGEFNGRLTASGKPFNEQRLTAAHRSLPLGTKARVTNLENGRSVE